VAPWREANAGDEGGGDGAAAGAGPAEDVDEWCWAGWEVGRWFGGGRGGEDGIEKEVRGRSMGWSLEGVMVAGESVEVAESRLEELPRRVALFTVGIVLKERALSLAKELLRASVHFSL